MNLVRPMAPAIGPVNRSSITFNSDCGYLLGGAKKLFLPYHYYYQ